MKVLEIFIDLVNGISLEVFELVLEQWLIKVIQVILNCNNLFGYIMFELCKWVLLVLVQCYDVVIIEDDVYGDLVYIYLCLCIIKLYDDDGWVLFCGLFFKVLVLGLWIGWMVFGCYVDCVLYMKYISIGVSVL